jgi:hypothetical protein
MSVGVVAKTENFRVFFIGKGGVEQPMAGAEFQFASDIDHKFKLMLFKECFIVNCFQGIRGKDQGNPAVQGGTQPLFSKV